MNIDEKLDKIVSDVGEIKVVQAAQHVTLQEHMKRSDALEQIVLPLQTKMNYAEGALKLIGFLSILAGIIESILWMRH
jgi:hypothetical protein